MTKKNGKQAHASAPDEAREEVPVPEVEVVMEPLSKEQNERIQKLIAGQIDPPNKFVAYMLRKIRTSRKEFEDVQARIKQGRQFLNALEKKSLLLQGEHNKYLEDIAAWDREDPESDEPSEPEAPPPPAVGPDGKPTSAEA